VNDTSPVAILHGSTRHGETPTHPERLVSFRPLDPANRPSPFKSYPGVEPVQLHRSIVRSSMPATEVLSGGRGPARELDEELLGTVLFLTAGVTRFTAGGLGGDDRVWFRTAMSAGNLHPVEVYVVKRGVHHYDPLRHALAPLRPSEEVPDASSGATIVLSGIPFRTCWKYGERGWRHLWWDAGTMIANLLAAAAAHGLAARVLTGFADNAVAQLVGIDGIEEMPLALVELGDATPSIPPAGSLDPLTTRPIPVAPRVLRFPLVEEAQTAGVLDDAGIAGWLEAARSASRPAPEEVEPPVGATGSAEAFGDQRIEDVILRRGSTRVFRIERAAPELLGWTVPAAARPAALDAAPGATLIEHFANVHDVQGADAGGYRYDGDGGFEGRVRTADARAVGAGLCLGQPLGGDSAFTVFHAAALDPLLNGLGARGYRVAQLEAGVVSGRLSLNAFALAGGATGLTFYDGLVSRYFDTDASPLLATAVGLPDTSPAPSGTPGQPVELRGYGNVMTRLAARLSR
jgi:SagB-type dehydrogenase family enzyme